MKLITKNSRFAKTLAIALSIVMLITTLNLSTIINVFALPNNTPFTITVTDVSGSAIEGATVTIAPVDESITIDNLTPVDTDSDGKAVFDSIYEYFAANSEVTELLATYTVTAENYQDVVIAEENAITVTAEGNASVTMKDDVIPTISAVNGNPNEWTKENITLEIIANDSDVVAYMNVADGSEWQSEPTFTITKNGTYNFKVKDSSDNESVEFSVEVVKIDKAAPEISSVVIDPTTWTKDTVQMQVNASDTGCGIDKYKMDDGEWQDSADFVVNDSDEHLFFVKDKLGNETTVGFAATADKFDNIAPTITDVICEDGWSNTSIKYTVTANDNKSGVAHYGIILKDNNTNIDGISWKESAEFSITDTQLYSFFVKDNAGNISEAFDMTTPAKIETKKPSISSVALSTDAWTNQPISFTVNATDEGGSEIAAYRMDNGEWQVSNIFENIADDHEHTFEVKDNAGNVSEIARKSANNYDNTLPDIDRLEPSTTEWTNNTILVKIIATDDKSGASKYRIDGGEWKDSNLFDIEDNIEHTFEVKDNAGNISEISKYKSDNYDVEKPELVWVNLEQNNDDAFARVLNFLTFGIFFNETITVEVDAQDNAKNDSNASGIKSYSIYLYDENFNELYKVEHQSDKAFLLNNDVIKNFKGTIKVAILDNAGNETEKIEVTTGNSDLDAFDYFMLENDKPIISEITPANESIHKTNFNFEFSINDVVANKYSSGINAVKVTVNDVEVLFDDFSAELNPDEVYSLIVDSSAKTVNGVALGEKWNKGKLEIKVNAYDNAGNAAVEKTSVAYFDQNSPIIKGFDFSLSNNIDVEKNTEEDIYKAVTVEDYGFYFKENVTVTITAKDEIGANETKASGVKYITYKAVDIDGTVKYSGTNVEVDNSNSITFEIEKEKNFKGQIYAFATDDVGNTPNDCVTCTDDKVINNGDYRGYVHPNGSIVESLSKHEKTSNIVITAPEKIDTQNNSFEFNYDGECEIIDAVKDYDDAQKVPLYKSKDGIVFKVNVEDTYSGIRNVKWTVFEGEDSAIATEKTVTVDNNGNLGGDKEDWVIADETDSDNLVYNISGELLITGNHNNMVLLVELTDRAGNTSYDYYVFGIDTTLPTIDIQYNVDENEVNDDENTDYFRTNRKAEIIITERNFRAKNVVAVITKDGKEVTILDLTKSDAWKEVVDTEDLDKTTYSAIVEYTSDGDYTFDIEFTDNAENSNKDVDYGESIAPIKFTVDKTLPTVAVEYDNNSAKNGNYYKADRTATITITEHNFDAKRVKILETTPTISAWKSEGDVHTATITYNTDGKYTLDIEFMDMAGNSIADFTAQEFYIDKTNPKVAISGIVDQSANNNDGNIGFSVTATDDNFDGFAPVLSAVVMIDGAFESKNLTIGNTEDITNGQKYTVTNIDTDGIYSITCTVVDKAGNAYSEVILEDANGKTYVEKRSGNDKLVTFSVNRNGSVFTLDSYTDELIKTYYVKNVTENVTIIEINADPILENTVTLNGKTLVENTDYTVTLNNNAGSWYKYSYSLNKTLFDGESEYNIVVSSKDKATNEAFSDVKDVTVKFVVDRTAPIVTVAGLKTNGRYQVDKQVVTLVPTDDGGSLKSLIVRTVGENGKLIKELINLSGDELAEALANGNITFELGEGLYQNVQIICEDYAGNIVGAETDEIYSNVSISSSAFMIFWANKPLRWGSIAGVIFLAAAIVFLVIFKKRKQER